MTNSTEGHPTTRDRVRELRGQDPYATQAQMARQIGCTRERVRQVLKALGLPSRVPRGPAGTRPCPVCTSPITNPASMYCSRSCYQESVRAVILTLTCDNCHAKYSILEKNLRRKHTRGDRHSFCSRICVGAWMTTVRRTRRTGNPKQANTQTQANRHNLALTRANATARRCATGRGHPACTPADHLRRPLARLRNQAAAILRTPLPDMPGARTVAFPDGTALAYQPPSPQAPGEWRSTVLMGPPALPANPHLLNQLQAPGPGQAPDPDG